MNKFLLWIVVWCMSHINYDKANANAEWDDAQNYMERRFKKNLHLLGKMFEILQHRANERADDRVAEMADHNGANNEF